jgi:hypothetical protein
VVDTRTLVINALKHAFRDGREQAATSVVGYKSRRACLEHYSVSDNGVGHGDWNGSLPRLACGTKHLSPSPPG